MSTFRTPGAASGREGHQIDSTWADLDPWNDPFQKPSQNPKSDCGCACPHQMPRIVGCEVGAMACCMVAFEW